MHINLLFFPTLLLTVFLILSGIKLARVVRSPQDVTLAVILATVLALPAMLFVAYYAHVLDRAAWFDDFRAAPYTELTAAGLGLGAGLLLGLARSASVVRSSAVLQLLVPGCVLLLASLILFAPYIKPIIAPVKVPLHDKWSDGVCLQSTPSTCGPCSAASLLRQFGLPAAERDLAWECFSYGGGTENWYVARALQRRGLTTRYLVTAPQSTTLPFPAIAGVQVGGPGRGGHFIAVLGKEGNRYIVGDPLIGKLVLTWEQLHSRYYFTGFFLLAQR